MYKKRTPFIFPFKDGLGVERFRVEFICESAAEAEAVAERGCSAPMAAAFLPADPPGVLNERTNVLNSETDDEPEEVVSASMLAPAELRALIESQDDDLGAPGEPPRCRAMGSCD